VTFHSKTFRKRHALSPGICIVQIARMRQLGMGKSGTLIKPLILIEQQQMTGEFT